MSPHAPARPSNIRVRTVAIAGMAIALLALALPGAPATAKPSKRVATEAANETLGKTVLTTLAGRTLYSLSAETHGRFICTGSCLKDWLPLTVPAGSRPTGPVRLGTIVRPDGRTQVTYKGKPLYRFDDDRKPGDVKGEGFKDVGTWHAAAVPQASSQPSPPPPAPESPY
jgi:predicted lipoprotein with Yx(FWY)xxD motif